MVTKRLQRMCEENQTREAIKTLLSEIESVMVIHVDNALFTREIIDEITKTAKNIRGHYNLNNPHK